MREKFQKSSGIKESHINLWPGIYFAFWVPQTITVQGVRTPNGATCCFLFQIPRFQYNLPEALVDVAILGIRAGGR